jgi:hypothetical protein
MLLSQSPLAASQPRTSIIAIHNDGRYDFPSPIPTATEQTLPDPLVSVTQENDGRDDTGRSRARQGRGFERHSTLALALALAPRQPPVTLQPPPPGSVPNPARLPSATAHHRTRTRLQPADGDRDLIRRPSCERFGLRPGCVVSNRRAEETTNSGWNLGGGCCCYLPARASLLLRLLLPCLLAPVGLDRSLARLLPVLIAPAAAWCCARAWLASLISICPRSCISWRRRGSCG